jgi:hypothetical protein
LHPELSWGAPKTLSGSIALRFQNDDLTGPLQQAALSFCPPRANPQINPPRIDAFVSLYPERNTLVDSSRRDSFSVDQVRKLT